MKRAVIGLSRVIVVVGLAPTMVVVGVGYIASAVVQNVCEDVLKLYEKLGETLQVR